MILKTILIKDLAKLKDVDLVIRYKKDNGVELEIEYYKDEGTFGATLHESRSNIYIGAFSDLGIIDLIQSLEGK